MFHYLFVLIPKMLFEPIAVCACLGVLSFLLSRSKRKGNFIFLFVIPICVMIAWRTFCHPIIVSSRYSSILLIPATIFTAYLFYAPPTIPFFLPKKYPVIRKYFCIFLFTVISISCILKSLKVNVYRNYINTAVQTYLADSAGRQPSYIHFTDIKDHIRILYYLNRANAKFSAYSFLPCKSSDKIGLGREIKKCRNTFGSHYFFLLQKKDENFSPDREILAGGEWKEIMREETSSRKNYFFTVFRYTVSYCENIQEWTDEIPPFSASDLCINGGFEKELNATERIKRMKWYRENNIRWYSSSDFMLPAGCWISVNRKIGENPFIVRMSDRDPLAEKYSLLVDTRHTTGRASFDMAPVKQQDIEYSGFIRNLHDKTAKVWIKPRYFSPRNKTSYDVRPLFFFIEPRKTYYFHNVIKREDFADGNAFFLVIQATGYLLIDNISIRSVQKTEAPTPAGKDSALKRVQQPAR